MINGFKIVPKFTYKVHDFGFGVLALKIKKAHDENHRRPTTRVNRTVRFAADVRQKKIDFSR